MNELGLEDFKHHKGFEGGEKMQVVKDALESNDYDAWLEAIKDAPNYDEIVVVINESNFGQLVEAHNLMQDGDFEGAKAIAEELGVKDLLPNREGNRGDKGEMKEIMVTLGDGDYATFVELVQDKPMADKILEVINESNFDQFMAMHELMESGDFEGAKAIGDELGLKPPKQGGKNHKPGKMGKRTGERAENLSVDETAIPTVA